ncbi:ribosome biogenesis GTPase [Ectothiorhodosinus mongolicus]|uniref:Small ribosomal subunit biogenesis GTPase RsgA n=1 Tax=Ectothiorhodosinus mongolicus TaxID=233100 RepID=A0A1R3VMV2_9GAMM|nr:ribosome small subunit-dependent GTPase A [Ectothiorhodosinus mongolicus]SIT65908.1 ribosome biogenesis GTPase [Ectothiorhodosinus mongolicus]
MFNHSRQGRIVRRFGARLLVEDEAGAVVACVTRRRLDDAVCNDAVLWEPQGDASADGVVTEVLPRTNLLERVDSRGQPKRVAANIDQLVIVCGVEPELNAGLIDQYLVAAENLPARAIIVYNKIDLLPDLQLPAALGDYPPLGYPLLLVSTKTGFGMDLLLLELSKGTSVLVGQSGVGKSSLVKTLLPDLDIRIGALSTMGGEGGRHTTSHTTRYALPGGGHLIDSPGVRDFAPGALSVAQLTRGFVEIGQISSECRFHNCTHRIEPGCAVMQAAVADGISQRRYESYLSLLTSA